MQWKRSFAASDHVMSLAFAGEDEKWKLNPKRLKILHVSES